MNRHYHVTSIGKQNKTRIHRMYKPLPLGMRNYGNTGCTLKSRVCINAFYVARVSLVTINNTGKFCFITNIIIVQSIHLYRYYLTELLDWRLIYLCIKCIKFCLFKIKFENSKRNICVHSRDCFICFISIKSRNLLLSDYLENEQIVSRRSRRCTVSIRCCY